MPDAVPSDINATAEIATLRTLIRGIAENQDRQGRQFEQYRIEAQREHEEFRAETRKDINQIKEVVSNSGKFNWQTVLATILVGLSMGGVLVGFIEMRNADLAKDIQRNEVLADKVPDLKTSNEVQDERISTLIGIASDQKIEMSDEMTKFRETMRREMALIVDPIKSDIEQIGIIDARVRSLETSKGMTSEEGQSLRDRLSRIEADYRALSAQQPRPEEPHE